MAAGGFVVTVRWDDRVWAIAPGWRNSAGPAAVRTHEMGVLGRAVQ